MLAGSVPAPGAYPGENGKIVVSGGPTPLRLYTANPDGSGTQQITNGPDLHPVWSPDGGRIAFVHGTPTPCPCTYSIHTVNPDGTGDTQVTSPTPDILETPTWSPDGGRIAFSRWNGSNYQIWVVDVDGSDLTQVTSTPFDKINLSWSPRGDRIAFDDFTDVLSIRPDGSDLQTLITPADMPDPPGGPAYATVYPDWSPDGSRLLYEVVYECDGDTCGDIRIRNLEGPGDTLVFSEGSGFGRDPASIVGSGCHANCCAGLHDRAGRHRIRARAGGFSVDWQPLPWTTYRSPTFVPGARRPSACRSFRPRELLRTQPHARPAARVSLLQPAAPGSSRLTIGVGDGSPAFARGWASCAWTYHRRSGPACRLRREHPLPAHQRDARHGPLRIHRGASREVTVRHTDRDGPARATALNHDGLPLRFHGALHADPWLEPRCFDLRLLHMRQRDRPACDRGPHRAIWALDKLRVYDGGPDEDADTEAGNSLFMTQGVFVP